MKRFAELHSQDQITLLIAGLEVLIESGHRKFQDVATDRDCTPRQLWSDICADAGFDDCEPWPGFPERPTNLPPAPGSQRRLAHSPDLRTLIDLIGRIPKN